MILLFLVLACLVASQAQRSFLPAVDPSIQLLGRFVPQSDGSVSFDHPGSHFRFRVVGCTKITATLTQVASTSPQPNYFQVFVDGKKVLQADSVYHSFNTSQAVPNQPTEYTLVSQLPDDGKTHDILVYKATEAQWNQLVPAANYLELHAVTLDAGRLVAPPAPPARRIEFLGDSITAGFCNLCHVAPSLSGNDGESNYDGWANRICQTLDADCHHVAWSGYGVVRNCCGGVTLMPEIYTRALASVPGSQWNFSSWTPDAVVINLGTNDHLPNEPDPVDTNFTKTYIHMVSTMAANYGKSTHFFLACGPMSTAYCPEINEVMTQLTGLGLQSSFLDQRGMIHHGCCGHPSVEDDIGIAANSSAVIKAVMGW